MTDFQVTQLVVAFGTLLTAIAASGALFVALYRESRNRKWEREDRERLAQEVMNKAQSSADLVRAELVQAQHATAQTTTNAVATITEQIKMNTALTVEAKDAANEAYKEANHVNVKIAALQADLVVIATAMEKAKPV